MNGALYLVLTKDSVFVALGRQGSGNGQTIPTRPDELYRLRVLSREAVAMTRLRVIGVGNRIKR